MVDESVTEQPVRSLKERIHDRLIDDWKHAYKFASVQISALGVLLMTAAEILGSSWGGLPPDLRDKIPHAQTIALALFALNIGGRVYQKKAKPND